MGELIQFVPRPNPNREATAVEITNVVKLDDPIFDSASMNLLDPFAPGDAAVKPREGYSGYIQQTDDTAPAEYVAPEDDAG